MIPISLILGMACAQAWRQSKLSDLVPRFITQTQLDYEVKINYERGGLPVIYWTKQDMAMVYYFSLVPGAWEEWRDREHHPGDIAYNPEIEKPVVFTGPGIVAME